MIEYLSKEKRFIMSKIKDATKRLIVEEASKLFLSKSIQGVTMSDIAREAEIGEATLYRYFGKKQNIVVEVAIMLFEKIYIGFTAKSYGNTGYEQIKSMYLYFYETFKNNPSFYSFIYEFDATILQDAIAINRDYENELYLFKELFDKSYELGLKDNSIKKLENKDLFYYSTTHSLLNLCKKLAIDNNSFYQNSSFSKDEEILELIRIILLSLEK